ncbi:MAG TPA: N-acetyltransferase, partial [Pseudomonas sp.]|nr:N-acetyltransferase [Pseudomonas sp.]
MSDTVRVHHDLAGHRFEAMIEGHCAYLAYMDLGKQTLDMYRTFVPDALRGRGIAAA